MPGVLRKYAFGTASTAPSSAPYPPPIRLQLCGSARRGASLRRRTRPRVGLRSGARAWQNARSRTSACGLPETAHCPTPPPTRQSPRRIDPDRPGRLEDRLEPVYHLRAERCELCSQMVDHRTVHARRVRSGTWVEPGICRKRRPSLVDTVALASCPFMHAFDRLAINAATMILAGPATKFWQIAFGMQKS